jgi:hypothetical protein
MDTHTVALRAALRRPPETYLPFRHRFVSVSRLAADWYGILSGTARDLRLKMRAALG